MYIQFSSHQELTTIEQNIHGREDEVCVFCFLPFWCVIDYEKSNFFIDHNVSVIVLSYHLCEMRRLTFLLWFITITSFYLALYSLFLSFSLLSFLVVSAWGWWMYSRIVFS